tara:strand:+ start:1912 stop:2298 length:387 start_codon:yes stop_codon:yes gene_type:complete
MSARKIPRAVFEPVNDILASDLEDNSVLLSLVKREVPVAIEEAFKAKKTFATLFEINTTGMFLDIPKNYWIPALEQCIAYNLEEEKFEDCISIKNLIEEIRKGNKTISKKTQKKQEDGAGTDTNTTSN